MIPPGQALVGTLSLCQPSYMNLVFGTAEHDAFVCSVARSCLAGSKFLSDMAENTEDEEDQMANLYIPQVSDRKVAACLVAFLVEAVLPSFSDTSNRFVFEICTAADYLDIPILMDASSKEIARRWEGSSVDDIRALWGFEDDLSNAEKQAIEKETTLLMELAQPSFISDTHMCVDDDDDDDDNNNKKWCWSFHVLHAILMRFSICTLSRVRAVSSVIWDVCKQLPVLRFVDIVLFPTNDWVDASLGVAERFCTLAINNSEQANLLIQLNARHTVYSLLVNKKDKHLPLSSIFSSLDNIQKLILYSENRVWPSRSLDLSDLEHPQDDGSVLGYLRNVQYLELQGENEISARDARVLATLPNLQHLVIKSLYILDDQSALVLSILQNLQSLVIGWGNKIGLKGLTALSNLQNLQRLEIDENNIGAEGAAALSNLNRLRHLVIGKNNISAEGAAALSALQNLQHLEIGYDNNIGVEGAVALSKIQTLIHLKIRSGNKIGAEGATALSALQNLQYLMIEHGNHIGTKGLVALTKLKALQVLKIDCDKDIELEGVESLSNLTNLEQLHIQASNETKTRLQDLLPNTEIIILS